MVMDDDELTPEEAATIEAFSALLVDEAMWDGPSAGLEDLIVAQIAAERDAGAERGATPDVDEPAPAGHPQGDDVSPAGVVPLSAARSARRRSWWVAAGAAVAGAAAAALITTAVVNQDNGPSTAGSQRVELSGTDLAPSAAGSARLRTETSGIRIDLDVNGLPDRVGGDFYQVWLKNCAGTLLIPAGSYHNLDNVVAWAGVSLADFPLITVTEETAVGGKDPAQGTSGKIVASGKIGDCPT
jgi:hypothetical protein